MDGSSRKTVEGLRFFIKEHADLVLALLKLSQSPLLSNASELERSVVKTIVSELGTNIIKYAKRGMMTCGLVESAGYNCIEILAEDQGPGIPDVELAMKERYSTGNSLGLGLPGVKRMSDEFHLSTCVGAGTRIKVSKRIRLAVPLGIGRQINDTHAGHYYGLMANSFKNESYDLAYFVRPSQGEVRSGDIVVVVEQASGLLIALVDVSGHGRKASALGDEIRSFILRHATSRLVELMTKLHERLRGTLGAAVSLLFLDLQGSGLSHCAVGNTAAMRVVGKAWRPISKVGVVGFRVQNLLEESTELSNGDVILLMTDGVAERMARQYVVENASLSSSVIAQGLVATSGRAFDDASCVVLKWIG